MTSCEACWATVTQTALTVFKTGAFNHSAIPPYRITSEPRAFYECGRFAVFHCGLSEVVRPRRSGPGRGRTASWSGSSGARGDAGAGAVESPQAPPSWRSCDAGDEPAEPLQGPPFATLAIGDPASVSGPNAQQRASAATWQLLQRRPEIRIRQRNGPRLPGLRAVRPLAPHLNAQVPAVEVDVGPTELGNLRRPEASSGSEQGNGGSPAVGVFPRGLQQAGELVLRESLPDRPLDQAGPLEAGHRIRRDVAQALAVPSL